MTDTAIDTEKGKPMTKAIDPLVLDTFIEEIKAGGVRDQRVLLLDALDVARDQKCISEKRHAMATNWVIQGAYLSAAAAMVPEGWRLGTLEQQPFDDGWFAGLKFGDTMPIPHLGAQASTGALALAAEVLTVWKEEMNYE